MKLLSVDPKNYPDAPVSDVFSKKIEIEKEKENQSLIPIFFFL